jgi:hypothetical protein
MNTKAVSFIYEDLTFGTKTVMPFRLITPQITLPLHQKQIHAIQQKKATAWGI